MKYKELTTYLEDEEKDTAILSLKHTSSNGEELEDLCFLEGTPLNTETDHINIIINPDPEVTWFKKWKDHMYIQGIGHLFSYRVIDILNKLKQENNFEYFPIKLLNEQDIDISPVQYFVINLYNILDCIDEENSILEDIGLGVSLINKLVIDETKIPKDVQLFNLEKFPDYIFFRDDLIEQFKNANISGCVWRNIEDIR